MRNTILIFSTASDQTPTNQSTIFESREIIIIGPDQYAYTICSIIS